MKYKFTYRASNMFATYRGTFTLDIDDDCEDIKARAIRYLKATRPMEGLVIEIPKAEII